MPDKGIINVRFSYVYLVLLSFVYLSLPLSRALLSFSVGLLSICSIIYLFYNQSLKSLFKNLFIVLPLLFFLISLFDYFRAEDITTWGEKLQLTAFWIDAVIAFIPLTKILTQKQKSWSTVLLMAIVAEVALMSVINYFVYKAEIDQALLESKHVPIAGGMHHIYFGILTALIVIYSIAEVFTSYSKLKTLDRYLLLTFSAILLICIHILSSRTGLLSLYLTFIMGFGFLVFKKLVKIRKLLILLSLCVLVPFAAYFVVPSFHNKIKNTSEDFAATIKGGEEVNYKSMGMRLEAWKVGLKIIAQHPFTGVGTGNVDLNFARQYELNKSVLKVENRIGPHNQFITFSVRYGLWASILFILLFGIIWLKAIKNTDISLFVILCLLFISANLESLLNRQHGIVIFCLFICLSANSNENRSDLIPV
jgi:O-antigen ligase